MSYLRSGNVAIVFLLKLTLASCGGSGDNTDYTLLGNTATINNQTGHFDLVDYLFYESVCAVSNTDS